MMRWKLRELLGEYQQTTGDRITYEEITAATNISPNTLSIIGTNKARRADLDTVEKLLTFLSEKIGRQLDTGDLLAYRPDNGRLVEREASAPQPVAQR
jgi:DNA-binding Xre family transcriptional regulator